MVRIPLTRFSGKIPEFFGFVLLLANKSALNVGKKPGPYDMIMVNHG